MKSGRYIPWALLAIGGLSLLAFYKANQAAKDAKAIRSLIEPRVAQLEAGISSMQGVLSQLKRLTGVAG